VADPTPDSPSTEQKKDELPAIPDALPVLPLRETVVFPVAITPLAVGQERSVRLVEEAMRGNHLICTVAQRTGDTPATSFDELYRVGTASLVHQLFRAPDGSLRILAQGLARVRVREPVQTEPYFVARIELLPETETAGLEAEALSRAARDLFTRLVALIPELPNEIAAAIDGLSEAREIAYQIASTSPLSAAQRQELLEMDSVQERLRRLVDLLQHELTVREMGRQLAQETHQEMTKAQREYFLREQLKTIQRELGEEGGGAAEFQEIEQRLRELVAMPEEARKESERELSRLRHLPEASPEHGLLRTWLEWMVALPWGKTSGGAIDVTRSRRVLDEDHYDLDQVKDRIVEYLAVKKLRDERAAKISLTGAGEAGRAAIAGPLPQTPRDESRREPLLCFIGAPGVGKTSLGVSIARAMGRKFVRISLGGVHDEAEIRGHRRTYIGAMPGRIMQAVRRCEVSDPVFMLDEVDKLGVGFQGDPAAALLEVLDPAQNWAFVDTYLGVPFDLSRVLFICTANSVETIPPPLLDRVEVIALPGYIEAEKLQIARRYLVPRSLKAHGLNEGELMIEDAVLTRIVREYTREAGVRNLERNIASIARKAARRIAEGAAPPVVARAQELKAYLGAPRFFNELAERIDRPGVATGLAWTPTGGQILFVEATMMPSQEERLILTGMLGDVMRESAQAALSYLRANAMRLLVDPTVFEGRAVHVHVPAGAIPKDGPSAGVAMIAALASVSSGRPVRNDVAMTGEISLRGKVLPVGGIKEKVIAAHIAGVRKVILPRRNEGDVEEIPEEIRRELTFQFVDSVEEALAAALVPPPERGLGAPPPPEAELQVH
jgi:ATP-dependent Lon protease